MGSGLQASDASLGERLELTQAIFKTLTHDNLKRIVDTLNLKAVDRRRRESLLDAVSRSKEATPENLLKSLTVGQLKSVCKILGLKSSGRKGELIEALLAVNKPLGVLKERATSEEGKKKLSLPRRSQPKTELEAALWACRKTARLGLKRAQKTLRHCSKDYSRIRHEVGVVIKSIEASKAETPETLESLKGQLRTIFDDIEAKFATFGNELENESRRLDRFSITVFGRTESGKSTLMEILTRGNGKSIGTGAQRTTRDIRTYRWKDIEITDVPGVAAFEGEDDEQLAYDAARRSDLICFLITDQSQQAAEAEHLARVRMMGKPVIGICNVKHAVDRPQDLRRFRKNIKKLMDPARLKGMFDQFREMSRQHVPNLHVLFLPVHLRSRYLADHEKDLVLAEELRVLSNFAAIEKKVTQEVIENGPFIRTKTYCDATTVLLLELIDNLLEFSHQNSTSGRIMVDKRKKLVTWRDSFFKSGAQYIEHRIRTRCDRLRGDLSAFVEENLEYDDIDQEWKERVQELGLETLAEEVQKDLLEECTSELSELARELNAEIGKVASIQSATRVTPDKVYNSKRIVRWTTLGISGVLGVLAFVYPPLAILASLVQVGGMILSWFFDDKEEKLRKARTKMTKRLGKQLDAIENQVRKDLLSWFQTDLVEKLIQGVADDFQLHISALFALADSQRDLAGDLIDECTALNRDLIEVAVANLKEKSFLRPIRKVARVPGVAFLLLIEPGAKLSDETRTKLWRLFRESIWFVVDTGNPMSIVRQSLGKNLRQRSVGIEDKIRVVHLELSEVDSDSLHRIRLTQQLTGYHVQAHSEFVGARR